MIIDIKLKDLKKPVEVSHIGKKHSIKECVYEFYNIVTGEILKYGQTSFNKSKMWIDRIYRQAGNIKGWEGGVLQGAAGAENWPDLRKDDVGIRIHDMFGKSKQECETKENELVKEYEKIHGHAPAGNIAKTNSYGPTDEAKTIYDGLFE